MRTSILQTFQATTTPTVVVGPSPNRFGLLLLSPAGTATVTVNTRPPSAEGDGMVLQAGSGPIQLSRAEHGDIVGQAWYFRSSSGNVAVSWIETVET